MRVVCFADLHSHNFSQFAQTLPNGRNSRLQATLDVLEEIRAFCEKMSVDVVFFLGDCFHSRTKIDVDVYQATWLAFHRIAQAVPHLYILVGNHDQYDKLGNRHSLDAFRDFATVIDQPVVARVEHYLGFAAHPFTTNYGEWRTFVNMLPQGLDFFLFHQGIDEAMVGSFDIPIKASIKLKDFPTVGQAKWCVGGHYHKTQFMRRHLAPQAKLLEVGQYQLDAFNLISPTDEEAVMFCGSPLQHSFSEYKDPKKCFWYWEDPRNGAPTPIYTNAPSFHRYTKPEKLVADIQVGKVSTDTDYVRLSCTEAEADTWRGHDWLNMDDIQVELEVNKREFSTRETPNVSATDEELLRFYMDEAGTKDHDEETLVKLGLELLQED